MSIELPESFLLESILAGDACTTRTDSESEWLARDNLETNPLTIKPDTEQHGREDLWVLSPSYSLPEHSFPIKAPALSTWVSLDNSFLSAVSPLSGPERVPFSSTRTSIQVSFLPCHCLSNICFHLPWTQSSRGTNSIWLYCTFFRPHVINSEPIF